MVSSFTLTRRGALGYRLTYLSYLEFAVDTIRTSSKGQIVIPKAIREALDIRSGTELNVELLPGEGFKVTIRAADHAAHVAKLAGSLAPSGNKGRYSGLTDDEAIALAVREDDARVRAYARRARRGRR
jgi:AbrB family looped-hinge helix DNA binding protein